MSRSAGHCLLIVGDSSGGGVGACAREQAAWFSGRGWRVVLALPPDALHRDVPGVECHEIALPRTARDARGMANAVREVRHLVRRHAPDVVHAHGMRSFLVARLSTARRPYVTLHGTGSLPSDPSGYGRLRAAGVAAIPWLARHAFNAGVEPHRGWDFLAHASPRLGSYPILPLPGDGPPLVLWLGSLVPQKRPELFVRAISRAAETTDVRGIMAGEGPLRGEIEALVRSLGAPVEILGRVDDVEGLLRRASAVALFSSFEALAFALQEAMWAGRPIIASPLPSLQWLLGETGLYADDEAAAAEAMVLLADRDRAQAAGNATAARVRALLQPGDPWPAVEVAFLRGLGEDPAR